MSAIAKRKPRELSFGGIGLASTGLVINKAVSLADWRNAGAFFSRAESGVQWWIGDWMNYGEGKPEWGDGYQGAIEAVGKDYQTLANYKSVSKSIEFSRRREKLSFSHHECVASLPPDRQDELLVAAESSSLSVDELRAIVSGKPHVSNNSGQNEWYTPHQYIEAARIVLGSIDLDPASSKAANAVVKAGKFFTIDDDGLTKKWSAANVWMNPPYASGLVERFAAKLIEEIGYSRVDAAIVLVNNATETQWFQALLKACRAACFVSGRIKFLNANLDPKNTPLQGQAFLYFGDDCLAFARGFCDFGFCMEAVT